MFKENKIQSTMYIAYKIGNRTCASVSADVRKILDVSLIQERSGGIGNFIMIQGKEIPVLNLYERLDQNNITDWESKSVLVLKIAFRETYSLIGLLVDEVISLFDVYDNQIQFSPIIDDTREEIYNEGYYCYKDSIFELINIKKLINTDESVVIRTWNKKRQLVLVN